MGHLFSLFQKQSGALNRKRRSWQSLLACPKSQLSPPQTQLAANLKSLEGWKSSLFSCNLKGSELGPILLCQDRSIFQLVLPTNGWFSSYKRYDTPHKLEFVQFFSQLTQLNFSIPVKNFRFMFWAHRELFSLKLFLFCDPVWFFRALYLHWK